MVKTKLLFIITTFFLLSVNAQERNVSGIVSSEDGLPIAGANVIIQGVNKGAVSDFDGKFTLKVSDADTKLSISFLGYKTQVITLDERSEYTIVLVEDASKLDEVVVVGYGAKKRANLTGAVGAITSESIDSKPITSASQSLAGTIAGVHIAQSNAIAGSDGAEITIRGISTLSDSSPLIIIDGVISDGFNGNGGLSGGGFDLVNPSDIESISVLKDAASASIYGARAANGVILITTKKGGDIKPVFTYESSVSVSDVTERSRPRMITDPVLFMTLLNEARVNSNQGIAFEDEVIELYRTPSYRNRVNTNWYDEIVRTGYIQEHNISARGGTKKIKYYSSLGYLKQDAIVLDGKYERITARVNIDNEIVSKLKVGTQIGYTYGNQRTPNGSINDFTLLNVMRATPLNPAYTDDGLFALPDGRSLGNVGGQVQRGNPLAGYLSNDVRTLTNNIIGSMYAEWNIVDNLKVRASINSSINLFNNEGWYGVPDARNWRYREIIAEPRDLNGDGIVSQEEMDATIGQQDPTLGGLTQQFGIGQLQIQSAQSYRLNPDVRFTYDKSFGKHNFFLLAGISSEKNKWNWLITERRRFESNLVRVLQAGDPSTIDNQSRISKNALVSQYGRLNYNFDNKYLFEANIRRDGSSRFGSNFRYGVFPSFSAGWVVTSEEFMENVKFINFLKLRGSWGQLGNQSIPSDFPQVAQISFSDVSYNFGGNVVTGAVASSFGNPDLKWETTTSSNIGLNMSLWNSAISIEADYFHKKSTDILYDTPIPQETGFTSVISNLASVRNTGFELALNFKTNIGDLKISGGVNASQIKNKVLAINPELNGEADRIINGQKILARGGSIDEFYLVKWTGNIFQSDEEVANNPSQFGAQAGDLMFEDFSGPDGVPDGVIDGFDRQPVGTQYPEWTYGGNINLNYKGFSASANFQGIANAYSYGAFEYFYPSFQGSNIAEFWVNRWTPDNPNNEYPRLWIENGPNTENFNTYFLQDRSFLRLRNVVVAYDFPKSVLEKISLSGLRVYASGQNLYTWTRKGWNGFDPEVTRNATVRGGLPQARTFRFGVRLTI